MAGGEDDVRISIDNVLLGHGGMVVGGIPTVSVGKIGVASGSYVDSDSGGKVMVHSHNRSPLWEKEVPRSAYVVQWAPKGDDLFVSTDTAVQSRSGTTGDISWEWNPPEVVVYAMTCQGDKVLAGRSDGKVSVLSASTGEEISTHVVHSSSIWSVAVSSDEETVAVSCNDGTIAVLDDSFQDVHRFEVLGTTNRLSFHPSSKLLASAHQDGSVRLWDAVEGKELERKVPCDGGEATRCVSWSPTGSHLLVGCYSEDSSIVLMRHDEDHTLTKIASKSLLCSIYGYSCIGWIGNKDTSFVIGDHLSRLSFCTIHFPSPASPATKDEKEASPEWST